MIGRRRTRVVESHRTCRRGTLFHYYMVYLFLSSVLMLTAGMCLHALLKADRVDGQNSLYLHSLQQLERSLRESSAQGVLSIADGSLNVEGESETVSFLIEENLVRKVVVREGQTVGRERFLFAKGTKVGFSIEGNFVRCRIGDPSVLPSSYQEPASQRSSTEILLSFSDLPVDSEDE